MKACDYKADCEGNIVLTFLYKDSQLLTYV